MSGPAKTRRTPTIRVELEGSVPVYRQVTDQLRTHIVEGVLASGDDLPSVRVLALSLGVHFNTIAEAYRTLAAEGWVEVERGRRAKVADRPDIKPPNKAEVRRQSARLHNLIAELRGKGFTAAFIRDQIDAALLNTEAA